MPETILRKADGSSGGNVSLSEKLFSAKINPGLMHQAVVNEATNSRQDTRDTKTRAEVAGGGRKPYRQKGNRSCAPGYDLGPALPPRRHRLRAASARPIGKAAQEGPPRRIGLRPLDQSRR